MDSLCLDVLVETMESSRSSYCEILAICRPGELLREKGTSNNNRDGRCVGGFSNQSELAEVHTTTLSDALTRSCSNLHSRHPLYSSNAVPKLLKVDTLIFKFRLDLLYRLFLSVDGFRVSKSVPKDRICL